MALSESDIRQRLSELNTQLLTLHVEKKEEEDNLLFYQNKLKEQNDIQAELRTDLSQLIKTKVPEKKEENAKDIDATSSELSENHNFIQRIKEDIAITKKNLNIINEEILDIRSEINEILQAIIMPILIKNAAISMLAYRQMFETSVLMGLYTLFKTHDGLKVDIPVSDKSEQKSIQPPPSPARNFGSGT